MHFTGTIEFEEEMIQREKAILKFALKIPTDFLNSPPNDPFQKIDLNLIRQYSYEIAVDKLYDDLWRDEQELGIELRLVRKIWIDDFDQLVISLKLIEDSKL
ncbi:MAG: hypothetical protein EZS28_009361 [Streblomastix strix]|uniref:Uncharacterized protein n=1 Tax=Streblomastix strix TaxID=222440 RepID=A0A5J4WLB1_9EUKA|nr:MAG: hypothetical protein EZS28_009361 [Streblomastix strix]